jgi:hypothetical protein
MARRTHRLAVASLAILTAVTLAACGGSSQPADPQPGSAQPTPAAAPSTAPASKPATAQPATQPAAAPTTATRRSDFGFIRSWYAKPGAFYLRFDRAVLLTGDAADAASAAHGGESPVPNDYYIQNDNPRLRDLAIANQITVVGSQQLTGSPGPKPISLKALLTYVHNGGPQVAHTPFHLTYNDHGLVTRIEEQYRP